MSDSSTGGFLTPVAPIPEAFELEDVIHDLIAGVTGLPGGMVRPQLQTKPPAEPEVDVDWCSFGIPEEGDETTPGERHHDDGADGYSEIAAHEPFTVLSSFYGPHSGRFARTYRNGLALAQNREYLYHRNMGLVEIGKIIRVPELIGEAIWYDRRDVIVVFRRRVASRYAVLHIKKTNTVVRSESGLEVRRIADLEPVAAQP